MTVDNGSVTEIFQELHKCSKEEMGKFDEPENEETDKIVQKLFEGGHLYCIDWMEHSRFLKGSWRSGDNFSFADI